MERYVLDGGAIKFTSLISLAVAISYFTFVFHHTFKKKKKLNLPPLYMNGTEIQVHTR